MIKNLIIFGTRPEAIKMAPLVKEFKKFPKEFNTKVCVTAQHREMLDSVLNFFEIEPDFDLNIMKPNQNLFTITSEIILNLKIVMDKFSPDYVYVHGDTTTCMAASLASFYFGAKVCHVEAGLRTYKKHSPFPEEVNRQITARIADYHFSPTNLSKNNLLSENIDSESILVTGNTVIDALLHTVDKVTNTKNNEINYLNSIIDRSKKIILVTGHRRENHGKGFVNICDALKHIALNNSDVQIIFPVHLNPNVKNIVFERLNNIDSINLIEPLSYPSFVWLMNKAFIIITDSGGVQEEAPSLGKPVLVMRDNTERPEALKAGTVILVGTKKNKIIEEVSTLINNSNYYEEMSSINNPYGDGKASSRIVDFMKNKIH